MPSLFSYILALLRLPLEVTQMTATIADLDAAIAAQKNELTSLTDAVTKLDGSVSALITAYNNKPDADLSKEIADLQANTDAITSAVKGVSADSDSADSTVKP